MQLTSYTPLRTYLPQASHKASLFSGAVNTLAQLDNLLLRTGLTMRRNRKQQQPQQKAWQGTNPITQRPSSVIANGTEKPLPKAPAPQTSTKSTTESNVEKHANDRALYLISNLTVRIPERLCKVSHHRQPVTLRSELARRAPTPTGSIMLIKLHREPRQHLLLKMANNLLAFSAADLSILASLHTHLRW